MESITIVTGGQVKELSYASGFRLDSTDITAAQAAIIIEEAILEVPKTFNGVTDPLQLQKLMVQGTRELAFLNRLRQVAAAKPVVQTAVKADPPARKVVSAKSSGKPKTFVAAAFATPFVGRESVTKWELTAKDEQEAMALARKAHPEAGTVRVYSSSETADMSIGGYVGSHRKKAAKTASA